MTRQGLWSVCILTLCWLALSLVALPPAAADPAAATLFVSPTGSGTNCSQAAPCGLQTVLAQAANGDAIYVAQGVYTGTGAAVVALTKSIALYGGWDGAASGDVQRDPAAYPTTLDGERARRVVYISGDITPTLDGFIVTGGNATGLTWSCPSNPDGCGGGIYVRNAHPVIANNVVTNNVAAVTTSGFPTATSGYGGGLFLTSVERAVIANNVIISNAGSTVNWGFGGGIWLWGISTGTKVQFNQIVSNSGTTTNGVSNGGGIYGGPEGALIQGNLVQGNRTNSGGTGYGAGLFQWGGNATYQDNVIRGNAAGNAVFLAYSQSRFEGNRVLDNQTPTGVFIQDASGNGAILVNNVVARSGNVTLAASGYDASSILTVTLLHNTLVGAGSGYGLQASFAAVYMTNTIVVSHTWGITNTTPATSTVLVDHTLFWANTNAGILGTNAVNGDPAFVNPAGGDFHISPTSAAINQGAITWVTSDLDGEPRLGLPDIGADEYWAPGTLRQVFLPLILRGG